MEARGQMLAEVVTGNKASGNSVFERYTEAARRAIFYARAEALGRNGAIITVADLLAGLSLSEDTRAQRVGSLKDNGFYLRWLSGLPALPTPTAGVNWQDESKQLGLDAEALRTLAFAQLEADRDREYWIDTDHLLRGLLRFPNRANFAVLKTEINLKSARIASRRDREEFLPDETPSLKVMRYLMRKHFALWVPAVLSLACYLYILMQSVGMSAIKR